MITARKDTCKEFEPVNHNEYQGNKRTLSNFIKIVPFHFATTPKMTSGIAKILMSNGKIFIKLFFLKNLSLGQETPASDCFYYVRFAGCWSIKGAGKSLPHLGQETPASDCVSTIPAVRRPVFDYSSTTVADTPV